MTKYIELYRTQSTVIAGTPTGRLLALRTTDFDHQPQLEEWTCLDAREQHHPDGLTSANALPVVQVVQDLSGIVHWIVAFCDPTQKRWILWANAEVDGLE